MSSSSLKTCSCGFSTTDPDWFKGHQEETGHTGRQGEDFAPVDISDLTVNDLKQIRLRLERSLSVTGPGAVVSIATMAQIRALDKELADRPPA
jgi:hypothetical protein